MKPFSLYLHIPYCLHKCPYCDFNTYALASVPEKDYVDSLLAELDFRASLAEWRGRTVQTIYFGGGTPSIFSDQSIARIVTGISRLFPVDDQAEITLEANPGTIDRELLGALREMGVNRLSIGVQSFDGDILKSLGRMHSPEQSENAVETARVAGFENINIDIIYSTPGQTLGGLHHDLDQAFKVKPDHISMYGLTIEKGTPFYQSFKRGLLKLPPEDILVKMMEDINSQLPAHGYEHYEISNFALSGREARHNLAYWSGDDYLGLGAGAHSFVGCPQPFGQLYGIRWANYAAPAKYMQEARSFGKADSWREDLDRNNALFEYFFLGLRKISGVSKLEFRLRFNMDLDLLYGEVVRMLSEQGLLTDRADSIALTQQGILLADSVIEQFAETARDMSYTPAYAKGMA